MEHKRSHSLRALCALLAALLMLLCACGTENSAESPDPEESSADESEAVISAEESETEVSMPEHEYNEDLKASECRALVSGGAAYTVSAKNTGGEGFLTDGNINEIQLDDSGVLYVQSAGKEFEITLDLGEVKQNLEQFVLWTVRSLNTADISAFSVYAAGEDENYTCVCEKQRFAPRAATTMGRIYTLSAECAGVDARYVRFCVTPADGNKAAFAEAAVYAHADNSFIESVPERTYGYDRAPEEITVPHVSYSMITTMTLYGASDEMAERYFDTLEEAGITGLIILHGAGADGAVYQNSALDHVFAQAKKRGMKVFMGMNPADDIFGNTEKYKKANVNALQALYTRYCVPFPEVFCGWYLTHEFSNGDFKSHPDEIADILSTVLENINALTPGLPLLMSPYCTSWGGSASQLKKSLESILGKVERAEQIIYCPQDGVGCGYFNTANAGDYLSAAAAVCEKHNVEFWVNLENFILGSSVTGGDDDIPAPVSRFIKQIRTAAKYADTLCTFTYEAYMPEFFANYTIYNDIEDYHKNYIYYLNTGGIPPEDLPANAQVKVTDETLTVYLPTPTYGVQAVKILRGGEERWYNKRLIRTLGGVSYLTLPNETPELPFSVTVYDCSSDSTGALRFEKDGSPVKSGGPVDRTKQGVNAALGKSYVATAATHDNADSGTELTDGRHGGASFSDPAWQGFNGQTYEITVDLGEMTHNIGDIVVEALGGGYGAVMEPRYFEVFVSEDGVSFDPVGKLTCADEGTGSLYIKRLTLELKESASARFVKISVNCVGWFFTDEIEIVTYE
ncbi:MAG: DUF4434 domain-containing protein [Clostridia bacterium]|nr:DUF4434 domain-containing protein [Clostridia bacterium]